MVTFPNYSVGQTWTLQTKGKWAGHLTRVVDGRDIPIRKVTKGDLEALFEAGRLSQEELDFLKVTFLPQPAPKKLVHYFYDRKSRTGILALCEDHLQMIPSYIDIKRDITTRRHQPCEHC